MEATIKINVQQLCIFLVNESTPYHILIVFVHLFLTKIDDIELAHNIMFSKL